MPHNVPKHPERPPKGKQLRGSPLTFGRLDPLRLTILRGRGLLRRRTDSYSDAS
jgi:hypothetical protein